MSEQNTGVPTSEAGSRANIFYGLARALEPPRNWAIDLPYLLARSIGTSADPAGVLGMQLSDQIHELIADREPAAVEHARLFLGPFEILVPPWGSFYLEDEPRLMGPTSNYAGRAFADSGLAPGGKLKDAPDHVTHELEFMYFLAFNEATTGDLIWRDRQVLFWREHLGRWLPMFAESLEHAAVLPFYQTLAATIAEVCRFENESWEAIPAGEDLKTGIT